MMTKTTGWADYLFFNRLLIGIMVLIEELKGAKIMAIVGLLVVAFALLIILFAAAHGWKLFRQGDVSMLPLLGIAAFLFLIGLIFIIYNLMTLH
ncbi:hypothetical protein [Fructobacillus tropaeoli]|nr:hypothetical protein [Fructobacillus tropaeoli]